jgi:TetR/AcrR family transcriptional regulator
MRNSKPNEKSGRLKAGTRMPGELLAEHEDGPTKIPVFRAAIELFSENDYSGTTMDEIALRAGVAKGTLFYRYGSKSKLMGKLLADGGAALAESIKQACALASETTKWRVVIDVLVNSVAEHPSFAKLLLAELWRNDRPWSEEILATRTLIVDTLASYLPQNASGLRSRATSLFGMVIFSTLESLVDDSDFNPGELASLMENFIEFGVLSSPI